MQKMGSCPPSLGQVVEAGAEAKSLLAESATWVNFWWYNIGVSSFINAYVVYDDEPVASHFRKSKGCNFYY